MGFEACCYRTCNLGFGTAERRVAIDANRVMHEHCYEKHLGDLRRRADERRTGWTSVVAVGATSRSARQTTRSR